MLPLFRRLSLLAVMATGITLRLSASPVDSKLLPLVPAGAQIVAGIEDPHNPSSRGRLLLVTHNTNRDYDDWVALTGADPHREIDEVIEVAASSPQHELDDHLLLVAGRFDRERIFREAERNGALAGAYGPEGVLVVEPLAREKLDMLDLRWMAILDDRIAIFGTVRMVQRALDRYAEKTPTDSFLAGRLAQLRPDVNSWDVLALSAPMLARHVEPGQLHAPWAHLLDGADELTVGIHYGSRARIDFAVHTVNDRQAANVAAALTQLRVVQVDLSTALQPRLESISVDQNRIRGSVLVPGRQFDTWLAAVSAGRSSPATSR